MNRVVFKLPRDRAVWILVERDLSNSNIVRVLNVELRSKRPLQPAVMSFTLES